MIVEQTADKDRSSFSSYVKGYCSVTFARINTNYDRHCVAMALVKYYHGDQICEDVLWSPEWIGVGGKELYYFYCEQDIESIIGKNFNCMIQDTG